MSIGGDWGRYGSRYGTCGGRGHPRLMGFTPPGTLLYADKKILSGDPVSDESIALAFQAFGSGEYHDAERHFVESFGVRSFIKSLPVAQVGYLLTLARMKRYEEISSLEDQVFDNLGYNALMVLGGMVLGLTGDTRAMRTYDQRDADARRQSDAALTSMAKSDPTNIIVDWVLARRNNEGGARRLKGRDPENVSFLDALPDDTVTSHKARLVTMSVALRRASTDGLWAEFGVWKGETANFIACYNPQNQIYALDSFQGLPMAFGEGMQAGTFSLDGKIPMLPPNVTPVKGWFKDTLGPFLRDHGDRVSFLHIDCDLYDGAWEVLSRFAERMDVGTVVLLDDFHNTKESMENVFAAWRRFEETYSVDTHCIVIDKYRAAFKILRPPSV
jgi:hypothetical protein